jgi:DNA-binding beta-propeller fold protein YncE
LAENLVKVYATTDTPQLVATIPTGELPHAIWPLGDGTQVYVALENGTGVNAIDTLSNQVIAGFPEVNLLKRSLMFRGGRPNMKWTVEPGADRELRSSCASEDGPPGSDPATALRP